MLNLWYKMALKLGEAGHRSQVMAVGLDPWDLVVTHETWVWWATVNMSEWLARPVVSHKLSVFSLLKMLLGFIFSKEVSRNRLDVRWVSQSRDLKKKEESRLTYMASMLSTFGLCPCRLHQAAPLTREGCRRLCRQTQPNLGPEHGPAHSFTVSSLAQDSKIWPVGFHFKLVMDSCKMKEGEFWLRLQVD